MLLRARTAAARRRQLLAGARGPGQRRRRQLTQPQQQQQWGAPIELQQAAAGAVGDLLEDILRQPPSPQVRRGRL
jgi:hypothetical protein